MRFNTGDGTMENIGYNRIREGKRLSFLGVPWPDCVGAKWDWEDFTCGFECPCGQGEFILTEDGGGEQCEKCGRVFVLEARVVVHEPK